MQGKGRGKASVNGGHIEFLHHRRILWLADMVNNTSLYFQPIISLYVVNGLYVVVIEIVHFHLLIVLCTVIAVDVANHLDNTRIGNTVTISEHDFSITVSLWVIGHANGCVVIKLLDTEVIT